MSQEGYISGGSSLVENISTQTSSVRMAHGVHTTIDADDTISTGLENVIAAVASLESTPVLTCESATAVVGDQAGSPAAGSIDIKTWMPTDVTLTTPVPATAFTKLVSWIAFGT